MSVDFSKILQSVQIRLRGRTALLACGLGALAIMFWVALRDYVSHPLLSEVLSAGILGVFVMVLFVATFGRTRPEEVPEKSMVQVGPFGVILTSGISSQEDLVELLREWSGIRDLPAPAARVEGSPSREEDYRHLSSAESEAFVADVRRGVEAVITEQARGLLAQLRAKLPPERGPLQIEGKAERTDE